MIGFFGRSRLLCLLLVLCYPSAPLAFSTTERSFLVRPFSRRNCSPRTVWRSTDTPTKSKLGISQGLPSKIAHSRLRLSKKSTNDAKGGFFSKLGGGDEMFNIRTTFSLVGGQAILIGVAFAVAAVAGTPNLGFGPGTTFNIKTIGYGLLMTLPLGALVCLEIMLALSQQIEFNQFLLCVSHAFLLSQCLMMKAYVLDRIEEKVPALQDVTTATQRSVLALLGSTFKPGLGLFVAVSLGVAAGLGEELLFRGVLQYELLGRIGRFGSLGVSSVIFGLLHAVTPMYAFLATLASLYFGWLYLDTQNLLVPIVTHAVYDIGALLYAHWTVANLSPKEQTALADWVGPLEGDR